MNRIRNTLAALAMLAASATVAAPTGPSNAAATTASRPPEAGCRWQPFESEALGVRLLVQSCSAPAAHYVFSTVGNRIEQHRPADDRTFGGPVVLEMFDKPAGQSIEDAIAAQIVAKLPSEARASCRVRRLDRPALGPGKQLYTLVPTGDYARKIRAELAEGPRDFGCGEYGKDQALTYFEYHPAQAPTRFAFVVSGFDAPLFDERSLEFRPVAAPAPHILVLVRHGHYLPVDKDPNPLEAGLDALGVAQARLAAARLAARPGGFDGLFVSPLQRARDTAAVIAGDFPGRRFEVVADLAECTPPTRRTEITADDKPADLAACQAQLDRVFARFFRPAAGEPRTDMLVCHGNVIRYLITRALGVDTKAWLEMSVGHASLTQIRVEADGRMKLIAAGDVGHLPPNLLTGATGDPERGLAVPAAR